MTGQGRRAPHLARSLKRQFDASANAFLRRYQARPRHRFEQ
ncbi:hypothetical protein [Streptomyces chrestomyceticus]